jgi:Family of unknown function (DUF6516)
MPGQRRTLDEYLADRANEFGSLGGVVRRVEIIDFPPDDATISAVVTFDEDDSRMLTTFEHIRVADGRPQPIKYGYRCFYRDRYLFGYDCDPVRHQELPYHKHVGGREDRFPADAATIYEVVEELWSYDTEAIDAELAEE